MIDLLGYFVILDGCEKHKNCSPNSICLWSQDGTTKCVCEKQCSYAYSPVCGSDGLTYASECQLNRQACEEQSDLSVVDSNACGTT